MRLEILLKYETLKKTGSSQLPKLKKNIRVTPELPTEVKTQKDVLVTTLVKRETNQIEKDH